MISNDIEMSFLIHACAKAFLSSSESDGSDGLHPDINWKRLISMSVRHRAVPLLREYLNRYDGYVPVEDMNRLHQISYANTARCTVLFKETGAVTSLLDEAGVTAMPFKGPVLSYQLYGETCARMSADVDFLLREADLNKARDALVARGYRQYRRMTVAEDRLWRKAGWGYDLTDPYGDITVNLRSRITPDYLPGRLDEALVWGELLDETMEGKVFKVPSPETVLVLLCWHGTKHAWSSLAWISDIHRLMSRKDFDYSRVREMALSTDTWTMVQLGMGIAGNVFGMLEDEKSSAKACLREYCEERIKADSELDSRWVKEQLFFLRVREGFLTRLAQVIRSVFRPSISDCDMLKLPGWLFPLYYLLRPFRLSGKVIRRAFISA